jgi:hypothetical protein
MTTVSNTKFNNNNNAKDSSLLGCYAVSQDEVSKDCQAKQEPGLFDPEDDGTVLRNVGNYTPNDTASHPRTLAS